MDILIFSIGIVIFVTYMFFLLRMINRSHKQQEKEQGNYNYKRQIRITKNHESLSKAEKEKGMVIEEKVIRRAKGKSLWRTSEKREIKDRWDS